MFDTYDYTNWFEKEAEESPDTTLKGDKKERKRIKNLNSEQTVNQDYTFVSTNKNWK